MLNSTYSYSQNTLMPKTVSNFLKNMLNLSA